MARIGTTLALGAAIPAAATAQNPNVTPGACAGNAFFICFALTGFNLSGNQLTFTLNNETSATYGPTNITTLLFGGLQNPLGVTSITSNAGGTWTPVSSVAGAPASNADNAFNGVGFNQGTNFLGFDNAGNVGVPAGQSRTFTFTLASAPVATEFAGVQLALFAQGSTSNCGGSTKAAFSATGAPTAQSFNNGGSACSIVNVASVPEPSTVALMVSGLVGLAGVAARRRQPIG